MKESHYIKPYTAFVIDIFNCIKKYFPNSENPLKTFAEGYNSIYSGSQEFAVLRNSDALLFYSVFYNYHDLFNIDIDERPLKKSSLYPDEVKIIHSCYPQNIRRWLNGTISRKKICRIDFCILAWCHAYDWNRTSNDNTFMQYQKEIAEICSKYSGSQAPLTFSLESLWKASTTAYQNSF